MFLLPGSFLSSLKHTLTDTSHCKIFECKYNINTSLCNKFIHVAICRVLYMLVFDNYHYWFPFLKKTCCIKKKHPAKYLLELFLLAIYDFYFSLSFVGDIMGPALDDLDKLLAMPYGCGEQNMVKFAPNIFVMQYLQSVNEVTPEIERKSKGYLQTGMFY